MNFPCLLFQMSVILIGNGLPIESNRLTNIHHDLHNIVIARIEQAIGFRAV